MNPVALIVAGGTGGHLYPGLALAKVLSQRGWDLRFAVRRGDLGRDILSREGFTTYELTGQGMPRRLSPEMVRFPLSLGRGLLESAGLLRRLRPSVVIGMGGYLSFPVLASARVLGIPTMIHEQNVLPGLSNRVLGRFVSSVAVSFKDSLHYFPARKAWVSGLPIRSEMGTLSIAEGRQHFGLSLNAPTVLVVGGSQGAQRLNEVVPEAALLIHEKLPALQILHIAGPKDAPRTEERYRSKQVKAQVLPYCHDMAGAYAAADLVICRAGASTVAELLRAGKAAVLIPFPYASDNHQVFNARVMEQAGLATILLEQALTAKLLAEAVLQRLSRKHVPAPVEPVRVEGGAAERLADGVQRIYNERSQWETR